MSNSPGGFEPRTPRLSRSLQRTELAYELALERLKLKLEQEKQQEDALAAEAQMKLLERTLKEKEQAARKSAAYKDYANFLNSQREFSFEKRTQFKVEFSKPGIAPHFHGYPSLPETPVEQRRLNKLNQQKHLKAELELQLEVQRKTKETASLQQKLKDHDRIQQWLREAEESRHHRQVKKSQERELLVKAWDKERQVRRSNVATLPYLR